MSCDDEEHLAKIIVESLREMERYFKTDGAPVAEAFRALDRAGLVVLELGAGCAGCAASWMPLSRRFLKSLENPTNEDMRDNRSLARCQR